MRLNCNRCGKSVSTEVPDDTVVRAWFECPECVKKIPDKDETIEKAKKLIDKYKRGYGQEGEYKLLLIDVNMLKELNKMQEENNGMS